MTIFPQNFGTLIRSAYDAKKSRSDLVLKLKTKHVGTRALLSKDRLSPFN